MNLVTILKKIRNEIFLFPQILYGLENEIKDFILNQGFDKFFLDGTIVLNPFS